MVPVPGIEPGVGRDPAALQAAVPPLGRDWPKLVGAPRFERGTLTPKVSVLPLHHAPHALIYHKLICIDTSLKRCPCLVPQSYYRIYGYNPWVMQLKRDPVPGLAQRYMVARARSRT